MLTPSSLRPLAALLLLACLGCTTTATSNTARTAKEQLLISNSVDQALETTDFTPLAHRKVFLEEKYLDSVDQKYIVGSIRHHAFRAGAALVDKAEDADVILEVRSGAVGTESNTSFVGMPAISLPGPLPVSLPEVKVISRESQKGVAKIGMVAYDAKTKRQLGEGGVHLARSDDNNWYVPGVGPYQNGSVRSEVARSLDRPRAAAPLPTDVAFDTRGTYSEGSSRVRLTSGYEER